MSELTISDLKKICNPAIEALSRVMSCGDHAVATDGSIILFLHGKGEGLPAASFGAAEYAIIPKKRIASMIVKGNLPELIFDYEGLGLIDKYHQCVFNFRGVPFDVRYLHFIQELPASTFEANPLKNKPAFFYFDGGHGVLMPCREGKYTYKYFAFGEANK